MPTLYSALYVTAIAFCTAAILIFVVKNVALRFGLVDAPGDLKIHTKPVPRLGGIGLTTGFIAGALVAGIPFSGRYLDLALALLVICLTSVADDLRGLRPLTRLVFHIVAGLLVQHSGLGLFPHAGAIVSALLTCLYVIAFVNAFNFLDGSDGLAGGMAALIAAGYALLSAGTSGPLWSLAISLGAACLAFLMFNFPPATIFMGDSGSTVLGFAIAVFGLQFASSGAPTGLAIPLTLAAIPLLDFASAVFRRLASGRSIFIGDRSHFYDLLLRRGWSPRMVALTSYAGAAVCVLAALVMARQTPALPH